MKLRSVTVWQLGWICEVDARGPRQVATETHRASGSIAHSRAELMGYRIRQSASDASTGGVQSKWWCRVRRKLPPTCLKLSAHEKLDYIPVAGDAKAWCLLPYPLGGDIPQLLPRLMRPGTASTPAVCPKAAVLAQTLAIQKKRRPSPCHSGLDV